MPTGYEFSWPDEPAKWNNPGIGIPPRTVPRRFDSFLAHNVFPDGPLVCSRKCYGFEG